MRERVPGHPLSERAAIAALTVAALAVFAVTRTYPNYDAYYHLVWGRELVHGTTPGFDAYAAPTEHPLYLAVAAVLGLFGEAGDRLLVLFCVLSLVALVWAVYRVGEAVFGVWPGLVAALFTVTSFALLLYASRAYVDVPFLAAAFWAGALEARSPRRGMPVMAMLTVAGLLRPEGWILAGAYWLWCGPLAGGLRPATRAWRLDLLAVAAVAPVGWAVVDGAVTGDPLHSLHATSTLADELGRTRGLVHVPRAFVTYLADVVRLPVFLAGLVGLAVAVWAARRGRLGVRSLHVPLALFGAGVLTFLGTGVAGLSILERYLTVPAVALTVFAGYGVAGWTALPPGSRLRRQWTRVVGGLAVVGVAFLVVKAPSIGNLRGELRFGRDSHHELVAMLRSGRVTAARRCGPLSFPTYRLVPDTRWILDLPARDVLARSDRKAPAGVEITVPSGKALKRFGSAQGVPRSTNRPDVGFRLVARNAMFRAYARCAS